LLLAYGGAFASLFRPYVGLLVYVCFAVIKPEALWEFSLPRWHYSRIIAIALLLGWVIHGCGNWKFGKATPVVAALLGFWLWLVVSANFALESNVAWYHVEQLSKTFLPVLVGITLIDSVAQLRQLAWVIVVSQGYLAYEFNLRYYDGFFVAKEFSHGGLDNNGTAITMVTCVGLAFFLGLHADRWWKKAVAFLAAALMAHVVLFSESRGGMLALLISGIMTFLLIPKGIKHFLAFGAAVAVFCVLPELTSGSGSPRPPRRRRRIPPP